MLKLGDYLFSLFGGRKIKVGFFGLGRSNSALFRQALPYASELILRDEGAGVADSRFSRVYTGGEAFTNIDEDILFLSPSVRRERAELRLAQESGVILSSDCDAFFACKPKDVFAVTGSDGKSTVTALAAAMLSGGRKALPCGNFGLPFSAITEDCAYVAELSSFNLSYVKPYSKRCVITNITPNHLNWHKDFAEYISAKANILTNTDGAVLNWSCPVSLSLIKRRAPFALTGEGEPTGEAISLRPEKVVYLKDYQIYVGSRRLFDVREARLSGRHNALNILSAIALTLGFCDTESVFEAVRSFEGLSHRCELVCTRGGVRYIDSSIDTSPERTKTTLNSLGEQVHIILGGRGKGLSPEPLIEPLSRYALSVSVYGEVRDELCSALRCLEGSIPLFRFESFAEAVECVRSLARAGDTVLLSPAATAYGEFRSFEERGNLFKRLVTK